MMRVIFLLAVATSCIFAGCHKGSTGKSNGSMSATINGESFSVSNCTVGSTGTGGLVIDGVKPDHTGRSIDLSIEKYVAGSTGTYTVTAYPDITVYASVDSNNSGDVAQSGTITIKTSTSSAITGTFSFTCTNGTIVTNVTNGVFDAIKY